jgi:hypothetical protein
MTQPLHKGMLQNDTQPLHKGMLQNDTQPLHKGVLQNDTQPLYKRMLQNDTQPLHKGMLQNDTQPPHKRMLQNDTATPPATLHHSIYLYSLLVILLIYLLTAIGLTPGGSSTVHIYTQTIQYTTNRISRQCHQYATSCCIPFAITTHTSDTVQRSHNRNAIVPCQ